MARTGDKDVDTRESRPGQGENARGGGGRSKPGPVGRRLQITRISDEDYRCVWRPCHVMEEGEGGEPAE